MSVAILGLVLLGSAFVQVEGTSEVHVARFEGVAGILEPFGAESSVDPRSNRLVSGRNAPRVESLNPGRAASGPRQWDLGGGGRVAVTFPFEQGAVNRFTIAFRPLNDFSIPSMVLRCALHSSRAGEALWTTVIGRRQTRAQEVTLTWKVDSPVKRCLLDLPRAADLVVRSVDLSHAGASPRAVAYLLAAGVLLPAIALAGGVVRRGGLVGFAGELAFCGSWTAHAASVLWLAGLGHSDALDSYQLVSQIVRDGSVVYAQTDRYNYGVAWSFVVSGLAAAHDALGLAGPETLHVLVSGLVFLGNLAIGTMLARWFAPGAGTAYALMPPLVLLTGFHGAFDTLALAPGMLAVLLLSSEPGRSDRRWFLTAAGFLLISLLLKHWMAFFLGWMILWQPLGPLRRRLKFVAMTGGVFLLHFVPLLVDEAARHGITYNVFLHRGGPADSFLSKILKYGAPVHTYDAVQDLRLLSILWLAAVAAVGWSLRRAPDGRHLPLIYLMSFVAFSPSWADVYFGGPLIACAVYHRLFLSWLYVLLTTLVLLASPHNVGTTIDIDPAIVPLVRLVHRGDVLQVVLAILVWVCLGRARSAPLDRSTPDRGDPGPFVNTARQAFTDSPQ